MEDVASHSVASGREGFVERPGRTAKPSEPAPCGSFRQRCACRMDDKYCLLIVLRMVWALAPPNLKHFLNLVLALPLAIAT